MITQENPELALPLELVHLLQPAFRYSAIATQFADLAKQLRSQIQTYLEATEDSGLGRSKSLETGYGTITYVTREAYTIDREALIEMVKTRKISTETLVNLAFPDGKVVSPKPLKTALGERFDEIATVTTTEFLTLRPTAEVKAAALDPMPVDQKLYAISQDCYMYRTTDGEDENGISLCQDDLDEGTEVLIDQVFTSHIAATNACMGMNTLRRNQGMNPHWNYFVEDFTPQP